MWRLKWFDRQSWCAIHNKRSRPFFSQFVHHKWVHSFNPHVIGVFCIHDFFRVVVLLLFITYASLPFENVRRSIFDSIQFLQPSFGCLVFVSRREINRIWPKYYSALHAINHKSMMVHLAKHRLLRVICSFISDRISGRQVCRRHTKTHKHTVFSTVQHSLSPSMRAP